MRVSSNTHPDPVRLFQPTEGTTTVRLAENIQETIVDGQKQYTYDEYAMDVPSRPGLITDVEARFASWMAWAKAAESARLEDAYKSECARRIEAAYPASLELKILRENEAHKILNAGIASDEYLVMNDDIEGICDEVHKEVFGYART